MSTFYAETQTVNPLVQHLQDRMDFENTKLDCLLVAHDDARAIQRLTDAMRDREVGVLPLNQSEWNEHLAEIFAWAIDAGIEAIMIVGHSEASRSIPTKVLHKGQLLTNSERTQSAHRLLNRIQKSQQELAEAKALFSDQLAHLLSSEELQNKECSDSFSLQTLFYSASGDVFFNYCISENSYKPVI